MGCFNGRECMTKAFVVSSRLPVRQRGALERLLFFNGQQSQFRHRIVESIESFGNPEIVTKEGSLRIRLSGRHDAQALFAVSSLRDMTPIGAVIYVRDRLDRFVIAHIAVAEEHSARGRFADGHLFFHLLEAVRSAAAVTRGVRHVDFYYAGRNLSRMHVRRGRPQQESAARDRNNSERGAG